MATRNVMHAGTKGTLASTATPVSHKQSSAPQVVGNAPGISLLAALARPYLSTEEAADLLCRRPQTLRKAHALNGAFLGVRPQKVGCRLLWPREALMQLIEGGLRHSQV